jgi:hypothetical protein
MSEGLWRIGMIRVQFARRPCRTAMIGRPAALFHLDGLEVDRACGWLRPRRLLGRSHGNNDVLPEDPASSGVQPFARRSGMTSALSRGDQPCNRSHELLGLVDLIVALGAHHAVPGMVVEKPERHLVERGLDRADLRENVDAAVSSLVGIRSPGRVETNLTVPPGGMIRFCSPYPREVSKELPR